METPEDNVEEILGRDVWKSWAAAAQAGDRKAYNSLLRAILPFIKGVLGSSLANPDWVEDVSQEVLISVHKSLNTYSPDRPFKPWLMAIIQFRRTDFLRKHYRHRKAKENVALDSDIFGHSVTNPSHAGEFKDIEDVLNSLPEKQRRVFEDMKIKGYSAKEIAKELGMTDTAVKVSAHRTLNKLKESLK